MDQVTRVMAAAQANGLYVLLDLHGLPGSQNGEQQSGRVGLNGFYGDANQAYSDQVVGPKYIQLKYLLTATL